MQDGCRGVVSVARWTGLCRPSSSLYLSQCHTFQLKAGRKDLMVLVGKLTCKLGKALQGDPAYLKPHVSSARPAEPVWFPPYWVVLLMTYSFVCVKYVCLFIWLYAVCSCG